MEKLLTVIHLINIIVALYLLYCLIGNDNNKAVQFKCTSIVCACNLLVAFIEILNANLPEVIFRFILAALYFVWSYDLYEDK